jgi:hypothetical protein
LRAVFDSDESDKRILWCCNYLAVGFLVTGFLAAGFLAVWLALVLEEEADFEVFDSADTSTLLIAPFSIAIFVPGWSQ